MLASISLISQEVQRDSVSLTVCSLFLLFGSLAAFASEKSAEVALDGYCPVCLVEMGKTVKGNPSYRVKKDGRIYLFPGPEQKSMFEKTPEKYVPVVHGDCAVCQVEMGQNIPGKPEFSSLYDGHLFLFPSAKQKRMFDSHPEKYRSAVIALNGYCPVCLTKGKKVKGKEAFSVWYDGLLYRFPSAEIRDRFLEDPEKYVPAADGTCLVCRVEMGKDIAGSVDHSLIVNDRIYLFAGKDQMNLFRSNPKKYLSAETAPTVSSSSAGSSSRKPDPKRKPVKRRGGSGSNR